jgi:hypothetical protein
MWACKDFTTIETGAAGVNEAHPEYNGRQAAFVAIFNQLF